MTVLQRPERLSMSRPQWRLLFQGGLGYTFDGMDAPRAPRFLRLDPDLDRLSHPLKTFLPREARSRRDSGARIVRIKDGRTWR